MTRARNGAASAVLHYARLIPARKGRMARPARVVALCAAIELETTTDPRRVTCRRCWARLEHGMQFTRVAP